MDKYICTECGKVFNEDQVAEHNEPSEAWGHIVYENWVVCPICGEPLAEYYGGDEDDD